MAALRAALKDEEDEEDDEDKQQGLFSTGAGPAESPPRAGRPRFVLGIFHTP